MVHLARTATLSAKHQSKDGEVARPTCLVDAVQTGIAGASRASEKTAVDGIWRSFYLPDAPKTGAPSQYPSEAAMGLAILLDLQAVL